VGDPRTDDAKSSLAAQDRMKTFATNPRLIIPGHDAEVFVRFPNPGNGVARLDYDSILDAIGREVEECMHVLLSDLMKCCLQIARARA
jgi:hypothetical protein